MVFFKRVGINFTIRRIESANNFAIQPCPNLGHSKFLVFYERFNNPLLFWIRYLKYVSETPLGNSFSQLLSDKICKMAEVIRTV